MLVVTASRLSDGAPIYYCQDGAWGTDSNQAQLFEDGQAAAAAVDSAKDQERVLCDPFTTKAEMRDGRIQFKGTKFQIRSEGPNIMLISIGLADHQDFGKTGHHG
tara:strand:- start:329 stop:643 length:315 start_codon:yes stop_codon:yes gene_type:complete